MAAWREEGWTGRGYRSVSHAEPRMLGPESSRLDSLFLVPTGVKVPVGRHFQWEQNLLSKLIEDQNLLQRKEKFLADWSPKTTN